MNKPWFVQLGDICSRITDGTHQAPVWADTGVPFLFVSNVRDGALSFETEKFVSDVEYDRLTKNCPIEPGDVLYTAVGSYGRAALVPPGPRFVFQRHIAHIKPRRDLVDPGYLLHALESPLLKQQADKVARGGAQKTVTLASLREFHLPLPSLDEQRRIATILDKADALRQKRKRAIALLDSLTQSMFVAMFDARAGATYDTAALSEVTSQITDGAHFTPTYVDGGVPFLRVTDIHAGPIDWSSVKTIPEIEHKELIKRCKPEFGDILLSKNGTIGVPRIVDWTEEFSIFVSLALLKVQKDKVSKAYLFSFLKSPLAEQQLRQHSKTGTVTNLHLIDIRKLRLPLPPLEKQDAWKTTADRLSATRDKLVASLKATDNLFASLQHRAFSGQL